MCAVGGLLGAALCPVGRYWAGTPCKGRVYHGTTSMQVKPNAPRPFLLHPSMLFHPKRLLSRAMLGQVWPSSSHMDPYHVGKRLWGTRKN